MSHSDDERFEQVGADASITYPKQCSALRKGEFVVLKNCPCKIVEMTTSKTGKHGHAKVHLVGIDLFTGKKCEDICPSTHSMDVPNVLRKEYQVLDVTDDGFLNLLLENGDTREDLKLDETFKGYTGMSISDVKESTENGIEILAKVAKAMDKEVVMSVSASSKGSK